MTEQAKEPVASPEPEMSLIDKVGLMHDLASACKNAEVVESLKKQPNGEKIFNIFVAAIERELNGVMNGKKEELPRQVTDMISAIHHLGTSTKQFRELISGFMGTPLVEVLNMMNKNLGGKYYQINHEQNSMPQPQGPPPQQQNHQPIEDYQAPRPARTTGLGSF